MTSGKTSRHLLVADLGTGGHRVGGVACAAAWPAATCAPRPTPGWWLRRPDQRTATWHGPSSSATHAGHPSVLLVVGVNGTGKTTTVGQVGAGTMADGRRVVLENLPCGRRRSATDLGGAVGAAVVQGLEVPTRHRWRSTPSTSTPPAQTSCLIDTAGGCTALA